MASARSTCLGCQQRDTHRQAHPFRRPEGSHKPKKPGRSKGHASDLRPTPTLEQDDSAHEAVS